MFPRTSSACGADLLVSSKQWSRLLSKAVRRTVSQSALLHSMTPSLAKKNLAISARGRKSPSECLGSWSVIYQHTLLVRKTWPSIWTVPLADDPFSIVAEQLPKHGELLEVGASNTSRIRHKLEEIGSEVRYYSFDIDRRTKQEFYSWEEVSRTFDAAVCFEVIEHLPVSQGLELCGRFIST